MTKPSITAVILAGGQATRMNGVDKGLIPLNGLPLAAHVVNTVRPQVDEILISANRNRPEYETLEAKTVADTIAEFPGPLAGMLAAMQVAHGELLFVCPCDSPFIGKDIVSRLYEGLIAEQADVAVAHDGKRPQPVFSLIRCSLLPSLEACLASGERKIMFWYRQQALAKVDFSDSPDTFVNINTLEERDAAELRLIDNEQQ